MKLDNFQHLQVDQKDRICTIKLNKPERLNALSADLLNELEQTLLFCQHEKTIKGILLTGEGKAFCAGADIQQLATLNAISGIQFARRGQQIFRLLETLGKPSLAAINGYAFGGGCELSMAATLRIATTNAQFGQPEVKLGIIPGYGGTQRLTRLVGKGRALDLCLTGRFIKADEALQWGLISEICSPENLITRAIEILNNVLNMGPAAIRHTMDVIDKGFDLNLNDALELEALYFGACCATQDKTEGVNAFLEKRASHFKDI